MGQKDASVTTFQMKARNGFSVRAAENGGIEVTGTGGVRDYTPPMAAFAIEEFCQAKRDDDLGRWRWAENPDYVVYPKTESETEPRSGVRVVHELTGRSRDIERGVVDACEATVSIFGQAARAYFEAHPIEPKPTVDEIISALRECARDSASGSHASSSPLLRGAVLVTQAADALEDLRRGRR